MPKGTDTRRTALRVALTGFGGLDNPGPGASVAQALRQGWEGALSISAWSYGAPATGAWLPGVVDRLQVLPSLQTGDETLVDAIVHCCRKDPIDALIPGEADIPAVSRVAARLAEHGIRTLLPSAHRAEALARPNLAKFLHDHGIAGPLTVNVPNATELAPLADRIGYPLCVRGMLSGEQVVYSAHQAMAVAAQRAAEGQPGVTLQYQVAGERYSIGMVADGEGRCRTLVAVKVVAANGDGRIVTGTIVSLDEIEGFAREVARAAGARGPLTLELVQPYGSNQPLVCDVACHLPAWCQASHWGGANLAVALLRELIGMRRKAPPARAGTMFVRGIAESAVAMNELLGVRQHGRLEGVARINGVAHPRMSGASGEGLTVAVTGTSTFDVVNPGLGVARALRQAPGIRRIYGLAYGTHESGAYQPALFDDVFRLPDGGQPDALAERIAEIHATHPFDALVPCLDGELPLFIGMRETLRRLGIRYLLPDARAFERRAKRSLFSGKFDEHWGEFSLPQSRFARSEADTVRAVEAVGLPAVVKGPLFMCVNVGSLKEARSAWQHLANAGWREVIVQRKISGPHYATSVLCDTAHRALSALTIKKLVTCHRGSTWNAVPSTQPALERDFARFLETIGWVGPCEGEFIRDEVTDRFYLIEVNPRFTGWIYFSSALGVNQPHLAVRTMMGEVVVPAAPGREVAFVRRMTEFPIRASQLAALATKGHLRHA